MTTSRSAVTHLVAQTRARFVTRPVLYKICSALLCLALSGCAAKRYSFVRMSHQLDASGKYDPHARPALTDAVAMNFADAVATLLRTRFTGARITREVSSTLQVALAAVAGVGGVFNFGPRTIAVLGLGSAGIPELQGIFNAKGRAEVYQDAVRLIEEAQIEYLAHNQRPSDQFLTQNGVTLLQRVTASMHLVEQTLAGRLPSVRDMQQATERMTRKGAVPTGAGAPAFNLNPASGPASTVAEKEDAGVRTAAPLSTADRIRGGFTDPKKAPAARGQIGGPTAGSSPPPAEDLPIVTPAASPTPLPTAGRELQPGGRLTPVTPTPTPTPSPP